MFRARTWSALLLVSSMVFLMGARQVPLTDPQPLAVPAGLKVEQVSKAVRGALAGWVYRDPSGFDLHIAQSDVASCTLELETRAHPLARWRTASRVECIEGAALEFHAPEPLPGVAYIPWDAEEVPEKCRRSS